MTADGEPRFDEDTSLFVYGSLLDATHREELIGRSVANVPATVRDFARGRSRYYYIVRRPNVETSGLLLLGLTPRDFEVLDRYEDIPRLYTRDKVEVAAGGKTVRCWVYLPTPLVFAG
jgi:gamma-glutamylcyclotransferase (GGCT)/AIG2-like uncharacterized protein YtfP